MSTDDLILSKLGLQKKMNWTPGTTIFDPLVYTTYRTEEYKNSSRMDTDEVYRMSEIVALHKASGLRLVFLTTEDYSGENVTYTIHDHFIITLQNKKLKATDINLAKKYFLTSDGEVFFSDVNKDQK